MAWSRARRGLALLAAVGLMAGCGGGISIGFGFRGDGDTSPPSITLAASASTAAPGEALTLAAAAADESGIDSVTFYRVDGVANSPSLGSALRPPYTLRVTVPSDGRSTFTVFARAIDFAGNRSDSARVDIAVAR